MPCALFRDRIFTGDTLLIGGCGRTDLPGGNAEWQYDSLAKLKALGDQIRVFPGHDYREAVSTLGDEKQNNPRMQIATKEEFYMTSRKPPLPRKIQEALEWNRTPIQGTQRGMGRDLAGCKKSHRLGFFSRRPQRAQLEYGVSVMAGCIKNPALQYSHTPTPQSDPIAFEG